MIVSFSVANFRSFAAEETLNMVASHRFSGHHENHAVAIPGTAEKVLRVGVLYGANGAGKSNLFKALQYLKRCVLKGRSKHSGTKREAFRFAKSISEPSSFDIRFIAGGKLYGFGLKVDDERVLEEWLIQIKGSKEMILYERLTKSDGTVVIKANGLKKQSKRLEALATVGGPQNQTFLATVRTTLESPDYGGDLAAVISWFEDSLKLIAPTAIFKGLGHLLSEDGEFMGFASEFLREASTGVQALEVNKKELSEDELRTVLSKEIAEKVFQDTEAGESVLVGVGNDKEVLIERGEGNHYYLLTIGAAHEPEAGRRVSLELRQESDGTRRLLNLIPALHHLRLKGGVYFIDEIDRSLHPLLAWKFLEFFLKSCDGDQRQVFVTTHESNLLDLDLIRRDEIWFAEKDVTCATHLYSLADFRIRKDLEVRKHYLQGRFGAVPFLGNLDRLLSSSRTKKGVDENSSE